MFRKTVSMGNINFTQKDCSSYMQESVFQKNQSYGQFSSEDKEYKTKRLKQYIIQRHYKKLCVE